ncbi:MAG: hypothetical protein HYU75_07975, partial [Betaproteobacteria bacterium]|nr:hypothetical protein [Betaproteobacteria bacterium]
MVALDVRNGMVSVDCAHKIYGVAVDPASLAVDEAETRRLRSKPPEEWDVVINEKTLAVELVPSRSE